MLLIRIFQKLTLLAELLAFLSSIIFLVKVKKNESYLFFLLMLMFVIVESLGMIESNTHIIEHKFVENVNAVSMYVEIMIWFLIYQNILQSSFAKKLNLMFILISLSASIYFEHYIEPLFSQLPTYAYALSSILISISALAYLQGALVHTKIQFSTNNAWFLISIAVIINLLIGLPIMCLFNSLGTQQFILSTSTTMIIMCFKFIFSAISFFICSYSILRYVRN
jgi:hypothetical protein